MKLGADKASSQADSITPVLRQTEKRGERQGERRRKNEEREIKDWGVRGMGEGTTEGGEKGEEVRGVWSGKEKRDQGAWRRD